MQADSEPSIQDLSLSAKDVAEGSLINLKFVRFQNVSALTVCLAALRVYMCCSTLLL